MTLIDISQLSDKTPDRKRQFFIVLRKYQLQTWALMATHTNGEADWGRVTKLGHVSRAPLRYKTLAGAKRSAANYPGAYVGVYDMDTKEVK